MIADIVIVLAAPVAGFFAALWLLLLCLGDKAGRNAEGDISLDPDLLSNAAGDGPEGTFIPMPAHLTTRDEMVAWMTTELPRLTAELPKPRI